MFQLTIYCHYPQILLTSTFFFDLRHRCNLDCSIKYSRRIKNSQYIEVLDKFRGEINRVVKGECGVIDKNIIETGLVVMARFHKVELRDRHIDNKDGWSHTPLKPS